MEKELVEFERKKVWIPPRKHQAIVGTRWVFKNKFDESGIVIGNIGCQNSQQEGIDYDETYAHVSRL